MSKKTIITFAVLLIVALLASCNAFGEKGLEPEAVPTAQFVDRSVWDTQLEQWDAEALNPEKPLWEQMMAPADMVDTSQYKQDPPWHLCFSNASIANTWRVTGYAAMKYELSLHPEIATFSETDAQENPEKQISDIEDLLTKDCDILIVSPATTEALTPAVEKASATGIPVVVFDRGVSTQDYVTFVTPIGGYAYGKAGADWLVEQMGGKGNMLVLRVLPGVDVLENRWAAAREVFQEYPDINILGVEFTEHDPAKAKSLVLDYLQRYGRIDGIYADFGGVGVAIWEAFNEFGAEMPPMTAEDYNGWLKVWNSNRDTIKSIAPTNPTYQWRTAIIAAVKILNGESVPKVWSLPMPAITIDNLAQYVRADLDDDLFVMNGMPEEAIAEFYGK